MKCTAVIKVDRGLSRSEPPNRATPGLNMVALKRNSADSPLRELRFIQ
jgi:hypothetical protein